MNVWFDVVQPTGVLHVPGLRCQLGGCDDLVEVGDKNGQQLELARCQHDIAPCPLHPAAHEIQFEIPAVEGGFLLAFLWPPQQGVDAGVKLILVEVQDA